ncbi:MAG: hypothetical protein OXI96_10295 [Acidimicrobiaceae bacterium]|nr:hypothetical protein [Acidimicrobiaceae bacterium]
MRHFVWCWTSSSIRTTVTLDSDTEQIIRQWMAERRVSFKQALNDLIRTGRASIDESKKPFRTITRSMDLPAAKLDKASKSQPSRKTMNRYTRCRLDHKTGFNPIASDCFVSENEPTPQDLRPSVIHKPHSEPTGRFRSPITTSTATW